MSKRAPSTAQLLVIAGFACLFYFRSRAELFRPTQNLTAGASGAA